jgi:hypothetical protein
MPFRTVKTIKTRLPRQEAIEFQSFCLHHQMTASDMLRRLIRQAIEHKPERGLCGLQAAQVLGGEVSIEDLVRGREALERALLGERDEDEDLDR